jgi:hypothetical protein
MKTTLDISDNILKRAKRLAGKESLTLRSLVEEGLELAMAKRAKTGGYRCRPVTYAGKGLSDEYRDAGWNRIRDAAYKGRGS